MARLLFLASYRLRSNQPLKLLQITSYYKLLNVKMFCSCYGFAEIPEKIGSSSSLSIPQLKQIQTQIDQIIGVSSWQSRF